MNAKQNKAALRKKSFRKIIFLVVLSMLPASISFGQSIRKVNSYLKEQAKETAITGAILVAENMTDWFSETRVVPAPAQKPVIRPLSKTTAASSPTATKPKGATAPKNTKRF